MSEKHFFDCITDFIFVEDSPCKTDIILVAGSSRIRPIEKACELYQAGYAPYILYSGGYNAKLPSFKSEWAHFQKTALSKGIPEKSILKEDKARHTFDNAIFSLAVLKRKSLKIKKALLVCKTHHARRALLTYQTIFPKDIDFIVCPVPDERDIQKDNWFQVQEKIDIVLKEVEKIGKYLTTHILLN